MKISKVRPVKTPERGTSRSAGIDFFIPDDFVTCILYPQDRINIPSGIKANVPRGYALIAYNKSGVTTKEGMVVGANVIDEDYTGEIHLNVINTGTTPITLQPGKKLLQCILIPVFYDSVELVEESELFTKEELEKSERGSGGFGSTGA